MEHPDINLGNFLFPRPYLRYQTILTYIHKTGLELLKALTTAAEPKEDLNDGDEAETKTKSKETSCICNKAKKRCFNISFDFSHIWTLYHDMN